MQWEKVLLEELHNPDFNRVQFGTVKNETGLNRFVMTSARQLAVQQLQTLETISLNNLSRVEAGIKEK